MALLGILTMLVPRQSSLHLSHIQMLTLGMSCTALSTIVELTVFRLSLLATFMSLAWFLTAHILEYTSVNSCRYSSPHLWWLTFGILCILYLMILEIFLLGLLVFVFGPVIYVCLHSQLVASDPNRAHSHTSCCGLSSCCAWADTLSKTHITSSPRSASCLSLSSTRFPLCSTSLHHQRMLTIPSPRSLFRRRPTRTHRNAPAQPRRLNADSRSFGK